MQFPNPLSRSSFPPLPPSVERCSNTTPGKSPAFSETTVPPTHYAQYAVYHTPWIEKGLDRPREGLRFLLSKRAVGWSVSPMVYYNRNPRGTVNEKRDGIRPFFLAHPVASLRQTASSLKTSTHTNALSPHKVLFTSSSGSRPTPPRRPCPLTQPPR